MLLWNVNKIDELTLEGGSIVFRKHSDQNMMFKNNKTSIDKLSGHGNISFNTSLADRLSGFLSIQSGSGHYGVLVNDSGADITDHDDLTLNLINVISGDPTFELLANKSSYNRAIDGGTYMYTLHHAKNKDGLTGSVWYLGALKDDENGNGGDIDTGPDAGGGNGKIVTTPSTDAVLAMAYAPLTVLHSELNSLRVYKNASERRDTGAWGHYLNTDYHVDISNGAIYKLSQNGLATGVDKLFNFDHGDLQTGLFMTWSSNDVRHDRGGISNIESYGIGSYMTWYDYSGFYAGGVIKGNRLKSKLNARMTNGGHVSGDWKQYAISASIETGYHFQPATFM